MVWKPLHAHALRSHHLHLEFKCFGWSSRCFFTAGSSCEALHLDEEPELCCKGDALPDVPPATSWNSEGRLVSPSHVVTRCFILFLSLWEHKGFLVENVKDFSLSKLSQQWRPCRVIYSMTGEHSVFSHLLHSLWCEAFILKEHLEHHSVVIIFHSNNMWWDVPHKQSSAPPLQVPHGQMGVTVHIFERCRVSAVLVGTFNPKDEQTCAALSRRQMISGA